MTTIPDGGARPRKLTQSKALQKPEHIFAPRNLSKIGKLDVINTLIGDYFGEPDGLLEGAWSQISLEKWRSEKTTRLGEKLFEIGGGNTTKDRFIEDLVWGMAAFGLANAVIRASTVEQKKVGIKGPFTQLKQQLFSQAISAFAKDIGSSVAEGRSVVLVSVHPVREWIRNAVISGPLDTLFVRKLPVPVSTTTGNVHYISTGDSTRGVILKAVKMLGAQPMSLFIHPDGPHGGDRMPCKFGPFQTEIGLGAPAITWFSKADLYFTQPIWTDRGPSMRLEKGPPCQDYAELEEYNVAFSEFYGGQIAKLIREDPRNIIGTAEIWLDFSGQKGRRSC